MASIRPCLYELKKLCLLDWVIELYEEALVGEGSRNMIM